MISKYYIGIDPGKYTGIIILEEGNPIPLYTARLDGSSLETLYEAYKDIKEKYPDAKAIGVEAQFSIALGGSPSSIKKLSQSAAWSAGICRCLWPDARLLSIQPIAWTGATGNTGVPKEERTKKFIRAAHMQSSGQKKKLDDIADAYFICKFVSEKHASKKLYGPRY